MIDQKIVELWDKTGMLDNITDTYMRTNLAGLLETQRRQNEQYDPNPIFKRLSIPLVKRVYGEAFIGWKLVSTQVAMEPSHMVYNDDKYGNRKESILACKTRNLKSYIPLVKPIGKIDESKYVKYSDGIYLEGPLSRNWMPSVNKIDDEMEIMTWLMERLINEINSEIIYDLTTHAKTKTEYEWKNRDHFKEALVMLSAVCERECAKPVNWFVLSKNLADDLAGHEHFNVKRYDPADDEMRFAAIKDVGKMGGRWKIFSDASTQDQVLCGYRGNYYDAGYQYCPFVPFIETSDIPYESEGISRRRMYMRYGKRMWHNGFYAAMKVIGFQPTQEEGEENE